MITTEARTITRDPRASQSFGRHEVWMQPEGSRERRKNEWTTVMISLIRQAFVDETSSAVHVHHLLREHGMRLRHSEERQMEMALSGALATEIRLRVDVPRWSSIDDLHKQLAESGWDVQVECTDGEHQRGSKGLSI